MAGAPSVCEVRDQGETWPLFLAAPQSQLAPGASGRLTMRRILNHWYAQADDGVTALSASGFAGFACTTGQPFWLERLQHNPG